MVQDNVMPVTIEHEIRNSFLDYSMSVIVSRALPDVRDGLKPVHRRILYAMHGLRNFHNKPYLKSARIVGDVIGKYHPHSDTAVYDALVRLAQNFSMRYPLVDGQGNFGSVDGDSAAAMRYTESRMAEFAEYLLADLDKETVDFVPNYDNKDVEPSVMPTMLPQLLVNGSAGIAVGMATNIPPHNIAEILSGLKALILDPDITILQLMEHIKGPDFPTNGEIHGTSGIIQAYATGRGSVMIRAKTEVEEKAGRERIIVTELPYQTNKSRLIEKIADLVRSKRIEGISDLRDESAKNDIRIVIDLKKGESGEVLLNNLYKLTPLQSSFGINMVALAGGLPKLLNLKEMLSEFYAHRRDVVIRRTSYLLKKAEEKAHILAGLKVAVEHLDDVVKLIKAAPDSQSAQTQLRARFDLSDIQAKAVLEMRLSRLTGLERDKIVADYSALMIEIEDHKDILAKPERVTKIVQEEVESMLERFGDERKTVIFAGDADDITMESLVADEEVAVTVTYSGYVKRTPTASISAQRRGGKGRSGMLTRDEDFVQSVFITSNHQSLLCFTNRGKVYDLKVYQVPEAALRSRGKHFANLVRLEKGERVVSVLPIEKYLSGMYIFTVTEKGFIKRSELMAYSNVRVNGIIGLKLDSDDSLVRCVVARETDDILIATRMGKAIRFSVTDVRSMGRASRGVTGIRFGDAGDKVIGMEVIHTDTKSCILSVCENGFGKRTSLEEYRGQNRGGKGIYTIKVTERNGPVVGIAQVIESDDLMIMTSSGKIMRCSVSDVSVVGRLTQGVKIMAVDSGEKVIGISKMEQEDKVEN